jgi:hypothetical protein
MVPMDLAAKLQLKPGQSVLVAGRPSGVELGLGDSASASEAEADALIYFCGDSDAFAGVREQVVGAARDDRLVWVAYPKAGALGTDLNRNSLAALVTQSGGVRPVRQVAIDDTWSALRFRPA